MKKSSIIFLVAIATLFFVTTICQRGVSSQTRFSMGQILRALASINEAPENEKKGIYAKVLKDVKERGVDFPLTKENETLLRKERATDELIEAIRAKSPTIPKPTPTPVSLDELEKVKFIPYRKGDKWGYVDEKKSVLIPMKFDFVEPFENGIALVGEKGSDGTLRYKLINKSGQDISSNYCESREREQKSQFAFGEGIGFVLSRSVTPGHCVVTAIDKLGEKVFTIDPVEYTCLNIDIEPFHNGVAKYRRIYPAGDLTYINKKGNSSKTLTEDMTLVQSSGSGLFGFKNRLGETIVPEAYKSAAPFSEDYANVGSKLDDSSYAPTKFGFIDRTGNEVIPLVFDYVSYFSDGMALVELDRLYFFINKKEDVFIPTESGFLSGGSERDRRLSNGLEPTRRCKYEHFVLDCLWGYIDGNKNEVIPFIFSDAEPFSDGIASVKKPGDPRRDLIDLKGSETVPGNMSSVMAKRNWRYGSADGDWSEGRACVVNTKGKNGFIDRSGTLVIPFSYDGFCTKFEAGMAPVEQNGKFGMIDRWGKIVIPFKYGALKPLGEGFSKFSTETQYGVFGPLKWGMIDGKDTIILPEKYSEISAFVHGLAKVTFSATDLEFAGLSKRSIFQERDGARFMYVDKSGKQVRLFGAVYPFYEGLACVATGGEESDKKYGFIDKTGKVVIPAVYDKVIPFKPAYYWEENYGIRNGLALVQRNGKEFYVDIKGTEYYEP